MAENKKISEVFENAYRTINNDEKKVLAKLNQSAGGGDNPGDVYTLTGDVVLQEYKEGEKIISYWLGLPTKEGKIISLRSFMGTQNTTKFISKGINETCTKLDYENNFCDKPIQIEVEEEKGEGINLKTAYKPTTFPTRVIVQLADKIQSKEFNLTDAKVKYIGKAVTQNVSKSKYHFGDTFVLPNFKRVTTYQCWNIESKPNNVTPEKQD